MTQNTPTWLDDVVLGVPRPVLRGDLTTDVVIIGGGITGTFCSYLLSKIGKKVVVLEKEDISKSATAYTTAWLNCVVDTDLSELIKMYTPLGAQKIWTSGMDAIDLFEKIIAEEKINCDFRRVSHYRYATSVKEIENLKIEYASAKEFGFQVFLHDKKFLPWKNSGSLELKNQAMFHPIKFLIGLRSSAERYGAVFYENTEVQSIEGDGMETATTLHGKVVAQYSIIATYDPFNKPSELFAHKGMYESYVIEAHIRKGTIAEGLYEDEKNPYHYFRIDSGKDDDCMLLGGEDHRWEIPIPEERNFRALESHLRELLPDVPYKITRQWRGPILETIDGLPYIGPYSKKYENRLVATGFSGNGITDSAIAGAILTDIILKKHNPYAEIYNASRKFNLYNSAKKAKDFILEFFGGVIKNLF